MTDRLESQIEQLRLISKEIQRERDQPIWIREAGAILTAAAMVLAAVVGGNMWSQNITKAVIENVEEAYIEKVEEISKNINNNFPPALAKFVSSERENLIRQLRVATIKNNDLSQQLVSLQARLDKIEFKRDR